MDVRAFLETTGIKAKESMFIKAPKYPYQVFFDTQTHRGSDHANMIVEHDITVELYTDKADPVSEQKIADLLNEHAIEFSMESREYIKSEDHYMTIYEFTVVEKRGEF